jgi:hypothetical protein
VNCLCKSGMRLPCWVDRQFFFAPLCCISYCRNCSSW